MFQEWIEELAKLALGLFVTALVFGALWLGVASVGGSDPASDGEPDLAEGCAITQPGETEPAPTTCSNAQVLLQGAAESFASDDPCPIEMIMIESPDERWCLSASAEVIDPADEPADADAEQLDATQLIDE